MLLSRLGRMRRVGSVCHTPNPVMDKERTERVRAEAQRLSLELDLDL